MTSRILSVTLATLALCSTPQLLASDIVTPEGREITLNPDGSWSYKSDDRIVTTPDGRRIRIRPDNTWEYTESAPAPVAAPVTAPPAVAQPMMMPIQTQLSIRDASIESYPKTLGQRIKTGSQSVFQIDAATSLNSTQPITVSESDFSRIQVSDSDGNSYKVIDITPSSLSLAPGAQATFSLRVDSSPKWWERVRSMKISFPAGLFGNSTPVTLEYLVKNMEKVTVQELR